MRTAEDVADAWRADEVDELSINNFSQTDRGVQPGAILVVGGWRQAWQGLHSYGALRRDSQASLQFIACMFDPGWMAHDRPGPDRDQLLVARIAGIARRHAGWGALSEAELAAAVAELREVAGDRPDLLAEEAGILIGASEGRLDEPRAKAAAQLCIAAGADEDLIPGWIEEGRRRAEAARHPPFSGGIRP